MRNPEIIIWVSVGVMIASILNAYYERDSFIIDGGYSVYKCREITK